MCGKSFYGQPHATVRSTQSPFAASISPRFLKCLIQLPWTVSVCRHMVFSTRRSAEGKHLLSQALGCLSRLQEVAQDQTAAGAPRDVEFLLRLEAELYLRKV